MFKEEETYKIMEELGKTVLGKKLIQLLKELRRTNLEEFWKVTTLLELYYTKGRLEMIDYLLWILTDKKEPEFSAETEEKQDEFL